MTTVEIINLVGLCISTPLFILVCALAIHGNHGRKKDTTD